MSRHHIEKTRLDMDQIKKDECMLLLLDKPQLIDLKNKINSDRTAYKQQYGEDPSTLHNLNRKILRMIEHRETYEGLTPLPQAVIRNTFYEPEHFHSVGEVTQRIETQDECGAPQRKEIMTTGSCIANQHENVLKTKPARFIVDAVGAYVRDYWKSGASDTISLSQDKRFYVIKDIFDNFCRRANIRGMNRRLVKEALFPPPGEKELLESIAMLIPDNGIKRYLGIQFINARLLEREEFSAPIFPKGQKGEPPSAESVGLFELTFHAGLFSYLEERDHIQNGKHPKLQEGFFMTPIALGSKIERWVELALTTLDVRKHPFSHLPYVKRKSSFERYCQALFYCIDKWFTGQENRKTPMQVTFEELKGKGILAAHSHSGKKHLRYIDIYIIKMLVTYLIAQKESFSGCKEAELDAKKLTITFHLDGDGKQRMPIL
jgi:hypothetical protein